MEVKFNLITLYANNKLLLQAQWRRLNGVDVTKSNRFFPLENILAIFSHIKISHLEKKEEKLGTVTVT